MYVDADEHDPERKMILALYFQVLQTIIVQDVVIYMFTCSTLVIHFLVLLGIPGNAGLEAQVAIVFYINGAAVISRGIRFRMRVGVNMSALERASLTRSLPQGHILCPAMNKDTLLF